MTDFVAIDFETANGNLSSVCSAGVVIQMDYPGYEFHCTCRASRRVFGKALPNHQLHTVAAHCSFDLKNHHHALADAEACAWIALKIL
ncbi:MAG: hypothetical protein LBS42_11270 [Tannerella sp.]|nr:hypothetical protein [Tannerella sp.]